MASTSAALVTSIVCARDLPPAPEISSATVVASCSTTSATTTAAPSAAKRCASTRPSPEPLPVMMATRLWNRIFTPYTRICRHHTAWHATSIQQDTALRPFGVLAREGADAEEGIREV